MVGQFGFGNVGDEGILQAIMDTLGIENEFVVATSIPFTLTDEYHHRIPTAADVRTIEDTRTDFDACIYGGGKVDWGFAWGYFIRAFMANKPAMAYGIELRADQLITDKLNRLFDAYFNQFKQITVRDKTSQELLCYLGTLTMCPAINLKEEKTQCPEKAVVVCPRFGDYNEKGEVDNEAQINWIVSHLKEQYDRESVVLIPFNPKDLEGHLRDLLLCREINARMNGKCTIFPCDGYNARKVKYVISRSKLVISGGRYHAIVWAIAHGIPYEIAPTVTGVAGAKLAGLTKMHYEMGTINLLEIERLNKRLFEGML